MFRTFSYNPDNIIHGIQMRFNQKPFAEPCVSLDPAWSPLPPLHDTLISYDFEFEKDVLVKSKEQLQDVVSSEPCTDKASDELIIPIENLIAGANVAPSALEPIPNGDKPQVNIEDFDSHNTDPFQDAELKTINDIEELQTLIFPHNLSSEKTEIKEAELQDAFQEVPSEVDQVDSPKQNSQEEAGHSVPHSMEELPSDPIRYMNINELPLAEDCVETHSQSQSPKPPVPAPRKLRTTALHDGNSPTPIPRHSAPKSPTARPPPAPSHSATYKQEDPCSQPSSDPSFLPPIQTGFFVSNLSESLIDDIKKQVSFTPATPQQQQSQSPPLSEEDQLYRKIADMGFPLDCVKNVSKGFDTVDERQLVDHVLAIQNVGEKNEWPLKLVETAYVFVKGETDKMKPYIETFLKYKEMGFPDESIHSALEKCGKDYEKMLEILIANT